MCSVVGAGVKTCPFQGKFAGQGSVTSAGLSGDFITAMLASAKGAAWRDSSCWRHSNKLCWYNGCNLATRVVVLGFEDYSCVHCSQVLSCYIRVAERLAIYFMSSCKGFPHHPASSCTGSAHGLSGPQAAKLQHASLPSALLCSPPGLLCTVSALFEDMSEPT